MNGSERGGYRELWFRGKGSDFPGSCDRELALPKDGNKLADCCACCRFISRRSREPIGILRYMLSKSLAARPASDTKLRGNFGTAPSGKLRKRHTLSSSSPLRASLSIAARRTPKPEPAVASPLPPWTRSCEWIRRRRTPRSPYMPSRRFQACKSWDRRKKRDREICPPCESGAAWWKTPRLPTPRRATAPPPRMRATRGSLLRSRH